MIPTPIKLTHTQVEALPKRAPRPYGNGFNYAFLDHPVVIVETLEESTPFALWREQAEADGLYCVKVFGKWYALDPSHYQPVSSRGDGGDRT